MSPIKSFPACSTLTELLVCTGSLCGMLKLCACSPSLFHITPMLTGMLLLMLCSCCVTRRDPSVQMHVPLLLSTVELNTPHSLFYFNSDPPGNQPLIFPGFHPHRAEGGQRGYRGRRLHRPVPGENGFFFLGKSAKQMTSFACTREGYLAAPPAVL